MLDKLESIQKRYDELTQMMSQPEVAADFEQLQKLAQERAKLSDMVSKYKDYKATMKNLAQTEAMLGDGLDEEMLTMVKQEIENLNSHQQSLLEELRLALVPKDPYESKNVIMEIRAGTGGDEAALFASELFRMYSRYAQKKGWQVEIIDLSETGVGGTKEVIFEVRGKGAFSRFKHERGVHRVQRVPVTEASGRLHTSTATVAVLPEAEEVDIYINPDDLRIDIFHASGAGGQNVNKVSTAVRITHFPSGIVSVCQDERSQLRNRQKAMAVLRSRLLDQKLRKQQDDLIQERRSQVGTGDRSEKIRTFNFPQDRVTDHRIGLTLHNLPKLLEGELDPLIDALKAAEEAKQLETQLA
jgi:peptide chain release factor 1